jgi:hypothetical protein
MVFAYLNTLLENLLRGTEDVLLAKNRNIHLPNTKQK